jgi:plastocyanin
MLLVPLAIAAAAALAPVPQRGRVVVEPGGEPPSRTALLFDLISDRGGDGAGGAAGAAAARVARLDEAWVSFFPKVQVLAPGSTLVMTDRDDESHTVHVWLGGRTLLQRATVPAGAPARMQLDDVGVVAITCDIHREMRAYVLVSRARWAAVSGPDGSFTVALPPGRYRVRAWRFDDEDDRASPPGVEPGRPAGEIAIARAGDAREDGAARELRIVVPPARHPVATRFARATGTAEASEPSRVAPTFVRRTWPDGPWALVLAALAMVAGVAGAFGNIQLAYRRGWSLATAVGLGVVAAGACAALTWVGLHGAVGAALGLGLVIGTAVFAAEERPKRT